MEQLFSQLRFAPLKQQKKQLRSAGELAQIVEPDSHYPFEFVCFRLTGYRPRKDLSGKFINGEDLIHDLQIITNKISRKVAPLASEHGEKVYTTAELAEKLSVSTKTIRRWRQRGLTGWIFVFENNKKLLGFPESSVNEFVAANPDIARKATQFNRISESEKQQIIATAIDIARKSELTRYQVILRTASITGRGRETIRSILIDHEKANPKKKVFTKPAGAIRPHDAKIIHKLYSEGTKVSELMKKFHRSRSSIHRIINQRRTKKLSRIKIEYISSSQFEDSNAAENILKESDEIIGELKDKSAPLLNRNQETILFRRYNYLKFLADKQRSKIIYSSPSGKLLSQIEGWLSDAEEVKKIIIEANMGLVVSVARKHFKAGLNMPDLVSEGNVSLMRAVEKFDYLRGYRFSTYATLAIAKDYAKKIPAEASRQGSTTSRDFANISHDIRDAQISNITAIESAAKSLDEVISENLTEREQYIIRSHFGLEGKRIVKKAKTLEEIGKTLNLTRERVRQIELIALQQLRHCLSAEQFDLLTKK